MTTERNRFRPYVAYVVDDAGSGRVLNADRDAIIREAGGEFTYPSVLVGWQCGFEPLFVAVHSYLDVRLTDEEAEDLAAEFLEEREWFSDERTDADYIVR